MARYSRADVDPEAVQADLDDRRAIDDAQLGSHAERRFTDQVNETDRYEPRVLAPDVRPAVTRHLQQRAVPYTCAPATLISSFALRWGTDLQRHSMPVLVDLCGCIYYPWGNLLRHCYTRHEETI